MSLPILFASILFLLAIIVAVSAAVYIGRELRKMRQVQSTPPRTIKENQVAAPLAVQPNQKPVPVDNAKLYRQPVMTRAEASFHDFLRSTIGENYIIETRKPLTDVFKRYGWMDRKLWTMHKRGHVDFLVIEPTTKNPLLGIELDDWTHDNEKGKDADCRKQELFRRADLKLLRFRVGKRWGQEAKSMILDALPHQLK